MSKDAEKARFARIDALFQGAIEREAGERSAWLETQEDDPTVLAEVRELLDEDGAHSEPLEAIVDGGLRDAARAEGRSMDDAETATLAFPEAQDAPTEKTPEAIGPYRILGRLGRGGLATVYLAERTSEFSMPVALKRIRRGMDTEDIVERLRLERDILARLVHPNIARLHDGGSDAEGRPYLVMEVIEGERIDRYCRSQELSVRRRLELFRQACEAVEFAHQNLILHRDLKPSNILVTEDGTLKLLDFGIAKVLAGGVEAQQTATENRLLTPDYASPEQMRGERLTTASDIYSLGVVLFQLLTGRIPHTFTPAQLWGGQRPDAPLASRTAEKERTDQNRQTPPADRWGQSVAVEIDAILAKALENEPGHRYGSAREFDDDIARLLEDRPVLARRPTLRYRLTKLARRHRALVSLAALAVLSLLVGIVGTSWQARVAERERLRAEQGQAQAEAVADFLVELFDVSDPYGEARLATGLGGSLDGPRGERVTARELLDGAALRISAELADDPARNRQLRRAMARAYFNLSFFDQARALLNAALDDASDGDALGRALVLRDLGRVDRAQALFDDASTRLLEAESLLRDLGADLEVAVTLEYLGELEFWRENGEASEAYYREAESLHRALAGEDSLEVARTRVGLARAFHKQDRRDEIIDLLGRVLEVQRQHLGDDHPRVLETQHDLAVELIRKDNDSAAEIFSDLMERQRRLLGPDHAELIITLYNLATVRDEQDRWQEAIPLLEEAWRIAGVRGAQETPVASDVLLLFGRVEHRGQRPLEAAEKYRDALALRRSLYGDVHRETATALMRLGRLWAELGDERARALLEEVRDVSMALDLGEENFALLGLGELDIKLGNLAAAVTVLRRGLDAVGPEAGWMTGLFEMRVAQALVGEKGEAGSAAERAEARALLDSALGHLPAEYAWARDARALRVQLDAP
ncbi:MAG: serine/threonine-protein kinase [Acidobacteriota bacterium]